MNAKSYEALEKPVVRLFHWGLVFRSRRHAGHNPAGGTMAFAYQPGLLPAHSWQARMDGLAGHFGDNAELPRGLRQALTAYLVENAADMAGFGRSPRVLRSIARDDVPLWVSRTRYFIGKHREIPATLIEDNPDARSSRCDACHEQADRSFFGDDNVRIPGVGRWND